MKITLAEIAKLTSGELDGDGAHVIAGAAGLSDAVETDISFLGNPKYAALILTTKAGGVFLPQSAKNAPPDCRRQKIKSCR